jgi:membrane protease YdiL (CAAX protease family)
MENSTILWAWLLVGALALLGWWSRPDFRRWLFGPQRHRAVPWTRKELLAAFFLVIFSFWPLVVKDVLTALGFFARFYGPEFTEALRGPATSEAAELAHTREALWLQVLSFPLTALTIPVLFRVISGTRPYQLGLTTHRAGRNVLAGLLAWVAVTPFVYAVLNLATWWFQELFHVPTEKHPLTRLSESGLSPLEWVLLVASAVAAAPVVEELLFRGVIQPWLVRHPWGGAGAMVAALAVALAFRKTETTPAQGGSAAIGILQQLVPALFVLVLVPPFLLVWRRSRTPVAPAVYGTSLLWAMMHTQIWPTPVPLFVLGLGLGYLAYRTQSLVAPLTLHALFNGVACVMLLVPHSAPPPVPAPEKGNETTSAGRLPAVVSTTTAVPGSWLPRRTYASAIGPSRGDTTDDVTCPTSLPSRSTRAPCGTVPSPRTFRPSSVRLTWPRSRAMTIGSWPR